MTADGVMPGRFRRRIENRLDVPGIERAFLSHSSGGTGEGFFTRQVRRFSIPISRLLLRLHVKPNHVTLAGFAFAIAAGASFVGGGYWAGVLGAFRISSALDSTAATARCARELWRSHYARARPITIPPYSSVGGIAGRHADRGFCIHAKAALVAAIATFTVMSLVGFSAR